MPLQKIHIRFKQLRQELGLSQIDFAARARIKQAQVSQIETGTRDVTDTIYLALEHHLHVNRGWLETGAGELFNEPVAADPENKKQNIDERTRVARERSGLKNANMMSQAERLRFFREQEKISADQLASELNVSAPTLSKYETGKLYLPVEVAVYLHSKYHMSYEWFFNGAGNRKTKPGAINDSLTLEDLYETQYVLVAKIDYLQKELKIERDHRKRQQKEINKLSLKIT